MIAHPQTLQQLIGQTPLVKISRINTGCCELYVKMESMNPGGSIKDRIAVAMVEAAEKSGRLKPGGTLIEATAGNTGIALAQAATLKGYHLVVVVPDKMSQEKISHLRATGAEVILTRSDVGKGHPEYYQDLAERLEKERPNSFYINQFNNPANPLAHETTTAPEIWEQMDHRLDAIVTGAGTGGHMTGLGRFFKRVAPHVKMVLGDPQGSILAEYVNHGRMTEKGSWLVEGIGEDFIPPTCEISLVKEAITVTDAEAFATARELLKKESIFAGSSTGTVVHAAIKYCRAQKTPQRVVTFAYDSGNKYLSKMYNDEWMAQKGFSVEKELEKIS